MTDDSPGEPAIRPRLTLAPKAREVLEQLAPGEPARGIEFLVDHYSKSGGRFFSDATVLLGKLDRLEALLFALAIVSDRVAAAAEARTDRMVAVLAGSVEQAQREVTRLGRIQNGS